MNIRYVNPASAAGGNGTTNATSGANRAYNSLFDWEAARQAVLADIEQVICETDGTADVTAVSIDGWTTTAAFYVDIVVGSAFRHAGVWDTAKFRIETTNVNSIFQNEQYVRITGMQVKITINAALGGSTAGIMADAGYTAGTTAQIYDSCIARAIMSGTPGNIVAGFYLNDQDAIVRNCLAYDFINAAENHVGFRAFSAASNLTAQNCTAQNCARGFDQVAATNCGAASCTTGFNVGTQTTCSSTAPTFVNEASDNFALAATDTAWKDNGTNLSATFTTDIAGTVRQAPWDIGAFDINVPPALRYTQKVSGHPRLALRS